MKRWFVWTKHSTGFHPQIWCRDPASWKPVSYPAPKVLQYHPLSASECYQSVDELATKYPLEQEATS